MRKKILAGILLVLTGFFAAGFAIREAEAAPKAQTICPVLGDPIDKSLYVDYQGYRIYFCCKGCPDEFKKNPAKYMKILKESGVTLEKSAAEIFSRERRKRNLFRNNKIVLIPEHNKQEE